MLAAALLSTVLIPSRNTTSLTRKDPSLSVESVWMTYSLKLFKVCSMKNMKFSACRLNMTMVFLILFSGFQVSAQTALPVIAGANINFAEKNIDNPVTRTSVSSLTFGSESNLSETFGVTSDSEWIISCPEKWIMIDRHNNALADSVIITVLKNKKYARSGLVTLTSPGGKRSIQIHQSSAKPALELPEDEIEISDEAGSMSSFDIISNTAWNIDNERGRWVTVNQDAGINNRKILLSAEANTGAERRTAELTVNSPGLKPKKLFITQSEAMPYLNAQEGSINLNSDQGSIADIMIRSNTPWNLNITCQWLTANAYSGEGSRKVILTAKGNPDRKLRNTRVTIIANGLPPTIIEVVQKGTIDELPDR